jgi:MFS-type transporter involved in bile tolerance (Atg22 family)
MNKRKEWLQRVKRNLTTFIIVTQIFGIIGAVLIGNLLGSDFQSYFIGYILGVIISLGGTIGIS